MAEQKCLNGDWVVIRQLPSGGLVYSYHHSQGAANDMARNKAEAEGEARSWLVAHLLCGFRKETTVSVIRFDVGQHMQENSNY